MKRYGILTVSVLVAAGLMAALCLCVPPALGDDIVTDAGAPGGHGANVWNDYWCSTGACPGGFLADGNRNLKGCVRTTLTSCSGTCYECVGGTTLGLVCKLDLGEQCVWPNTSRPALNCGNKRKYFNGCMYSAATPAGWAGPPTGNKCYCTGAWSNTGETCWVAQCI